MAEPGDEIAVDRAVRHLEDVVGELHVHPADAPAGHHRMIAVVEAADDPAARHDEAVELVALAECGDLAAAHPEGVDPVALVDAAEDAAVTDLEAVGARALTDGAGDRSRSPW